MHITLHLRGEESNRDEACSPLFTEKYPHHHLKVYVADTVAYAKEHRVSIVDGGTSRIGYAHFKKSSRAGRCRANSPFGHHKNDLVETSFINPVAREGEVWWA